MNNHAAIFLRRPCLAHCAVSFLTSGGFNKIYVVEVGYDQRFVLRVSLPVDPRHKMAGELATLGWLSQHSTVPVPRVIAFDDTRDNKIGFEWILMDHVSGTSAQTRWRKMTMEDKKTLVENIARHHAQLLDISTFQQTGTLKETDSGFIPDRLASMMFFWGDHYNFDVHRGPFRSSHGWLYSFLFIMIKGKVLAMDKAVREGDEEDAGEAMYNLRIAKELYLLLPETFKPDEDTDDKKVLWHDDLSLSNI
ncbi:hypothetical protein FOMG_09488 [Fusarium oxysporum f. sp. melonis 26406]|uniref:Aminoglycoside phosphotransferase domain-containing protein n=1 Tax=Fusarium oxysporum f. sp. melonis 26406 TaxID=1089452 RepID=W9ZWQ9_FUSOX|nr:hypothetical protein FOMG_09488 [Fusarium oxysporum f. sp. melonis 26406]